MNLELKEKIIESLKRIPGISKKQANKIVVFFLKINFKIQKSYLKISLF